MKRCPQCEFIYNDDQNLCDMDGRALVYDDALATLPYSSLPVNDLQVPKSRLRVLTVPALAGLILAAFICLGYYAAPRLIAKPETRGSSESQKLKNDSLPETAPASTDPSKPTTEPAKAADTSQSIGDARDPSEPTSAIQRNSSKAAKVEKPDQRLTIARRLPPLRRVPPLPRLPPAKLRSTTSANSVSTQEKRTEVAGVNQKKESGVRSFLKKTGQILKKPFKL
jgi:cytoskeletal protein RodZ